MYIGTGTLILLFILLEIYEKNKDKEPDKTKEDRINEEIDDFLKKAEWDNLPEEIKKSDIGYLYGRSKYEKKENTADDKMPKWGCTALVWAVLFMSPLFWIGIFFFPYYLGILAVCTVLSVTLDIGFIVLYKILDLLFKNRVTN